MQPAKYTTSNLTGSMTYRAACSFAASSFAEENTVASFRA